MKVVLLSLKADFLTSVREFSTILFGILIPAVLMLVIGFLYSSSNYMATDVPYSMLNATFASVIVMSSCSSGIMGLPIVISSHRERKVLKSFKVTPISPIYILMSSLLLTILVSILGFVLVLIVAKLVFSITFSGNLFIIFLAYLLTVIAFDCIGLLIASFSPSASVTGFISSFVYFPMLLLSGITIPIEIFPSFIKSFAFFMPATHAVNILKALSVDKIDSFDIFGSIIYLVVIIIVAIPISIKFFKWE